MTNGDLPGVLVDVVEFDVGAATVDMARGITGTCERLSVKSFPWGPSGSYGQVLVSRSYASVDCHFSRHVAMNQQPCCESKLDFPLPLRVPWCLRLWGPFGASRNGHGSRPWAWLLLAALPVGHCQIKDERARHLQDTLPVPNHSANSQAKYQAKNSRNLNSQIPVIPICQISIPKISAKNFVQHLPPINPRYPSPINPRYFLA